MPANLRLRTEWLNVNNDHIPNKHRHIAQHILFIQFKIMHCSRQPLSVAALTALLTARQLFVVDERLPAWQWEIERAREKSMREICAIRSGERGCGHKVLHIAIRIAEQRRLRLKLLTRIHWGKIKEGEERMTIPKEVIWEECGRCCRRRATRMSTGSETCL